MAKGSLTIEVTNARGGALSGKFQIDLKPHAQAIGGDAMEVTFDVRGHTRFEISNVSCHDGPGTLYAFRLNADGYKPYSFFQLMKPRARNLPSEARVRLIANPRRISNITAAGFSDLPATFRRALESAVMVELAAEDRDLVGLSGAAARAGAPDDRSRRRLRVSLSGLE